MKLVSRDRPAAELKAFKAVFHLAGELLIEEPFAWRGFEFMKVDGTGMATFLFRAEDRAQAAAHMPEIEAELSTCLDLFALVFNRSLSVAWSSEPIEPGPYVRMNVEVLLDPEQLPEAAALEEGIQAEERCGRRVGLALRWYRKSLLTSDCEDVFLTSWFALEALAAHRRRDLTEEEAEAFERAKAALLNELPAKHFPSLRSLAAGSWSEEVRALSIPEAMTRAVRAALGEGEMLLGAPISASLKGLQGDRSNLVHHGTPIPDVCSKAGEIRELARRVMWALADGTYVIREIQTATQRDLGGVRGIGEATARRLVAHRRHLDSGRGIGQLAAVRGVGSAKALSLRQWAFASGLRERP
jgi:hypothetical protein